MSARDLIVSTVSRAVAASLAVNWALRGRAETVASRAHRLGLQADIVPRGRARCAVLVSGPGLFARLYGARDAPADDAISEIMGGRP